MKKFAAILSLLVVAGIAVYLVFNNPLGRLVKLAIEEFGPPMLQAEVKVGSVEISATDGRGTISALVLGNPKGFKAPYALKAGKIDIGIEPASLADNVVVIHTLTIDAPDINYEKGDNGANFDVLERNVEQYLGVDANKSKGPGKKLIIDRFVLRHAHVSYNGNLSMTLPDVALSDIGKKTNGATPAQAAHAIIGELAKQMALAIPRAVANGVESAVKGIFGK